MAVQLPELSREEFAAQLEAESLRLTAPCVSALWAHYRELRRWAARLSLIGPGTAAEVVPRHYVESLAASPWIAAGGELVDVGSGAGFPGLILAAAVPCLEVALVESRTRKAAFLAAAARKMGVRVRVLADRIGRELPADLPARIDFLCLRAVRLDPRAWRSLVERLSASGRVVVWTGRKEPELPDTLGLEDETVLAGSDRRIQVYCRREIAGEEAEWERSSRS